MDWNEFGWIILAYIVLSVLSATVWTAQVLLRERKESVPFDFDRTLKGFFKRTGRALWRLSGLAGVALGILLIKILRILLK
jgi:hypothetical protein